MAAREYSPAVRPSFAFWLQYSKTRDRTFFAQYVICFWEQSLLCLEHMGRHSLKFVNWEQRKEIAADLKAIYTSTTVEAGEQRLTEFEEKLNQTLTPVGQSWRRNWARSFRFSALHLKSGRFSMHQCYRIDQHEPSQDHQDPRRVPE